MLRPFPPHLLNDDDDEEEDEPREDRRHKDEGEGELGMPAGDRIAQIASWSAGVAGRTFTPPTARLISGRRRCE